MSNILFFRITRYSVDAQNTHAHSTLWTYVRKPYPYEHLRTARRSQDSQNHHRLINTGTQTLSLWAPSEDWADRSQDSRSHHKHLAVDRDVAYRPEHAHTLTPMNTRTQTLPLWAPPTGASLSTETSPTTESIAPLNPVINSEKCEHPCQVGDLNPGGQIPPQRT
jgi:hypothetical protein